jgi:hypothetical protein
MTKGLHYIKSRGHNSRTASNVDSVLWPEIKPQAERFIFNLTVGTFAGLRDTTFSGDSKLYGRAKCILSIYFSQFCYIRISLPTRNIPFRLSHLQYRLIPLYLTFSPLNFIKTFGFRKLFLLPASGCKMIKKMEFT